jgi:hypothetical protein
MEYADQQTAEMSKNIAFSSLFLKPGAEISTKPNSLNEGATEGQSGTPSAESKETALNNTVSVSSSVNTAGAAGPELGNPVEGAQTLGANDAVNTTLQVPSEEGLGTSSSALTNPAGLPGLTNDLLASSENLFEQPPANGPPDGLSDSDLGDFVIDRATDLISQNGLTKLPSETSDGVTRTQYVDSANIPVFEVRDHANHSEIIVYDKDAADQFGTNGGGVVFLADRAGGKMNGRDTVIVVHDGNPQILGHELEEAWAVMRKADIENGVSVESHPVEKINLLKEYIAAEEQSGGSQGLSDATHAFAEAMGLPGEEISGQGEFTRGPPVNTIEDLFKALQDREVPVENIPSLKTQPSRHLIVSNSKKLRKRLVKRGSD